MWRGGLLAPMVVVVALSGCGDDTDGRGNAAIGGECRDAGEMLATSLEASLTARPAAELKGLRTVKIHDGPDAPLTLLKKGAHVASGTLVAAGGSPRTVSWVVSESMVTTGGGVAFGLDPATNNASALGSAAKPGSPIRDYAEAIRKSEAYEQSRSCSQASSNATSEASSRPNAKPRREVSHDEFIEKLDRLCRSGTAKLERVDDRSFASKDPHVVANAFDASVEQYDLVLSKLEEFSVPDADRSAFDEYVAAIKRSRRIAAQISDKLRAEQPVAHLVKTLTDEKTKRLGTALVLGAEDCG